MIINICKPYNKGIKQANKVSVPLSSKAHFRLRSDNSDLLVIIPDNYRPSGTKTTISANIVRYRK
jgi:hypothetical protein